jgi:pimeloyl-ACP methyl ester carboxylesterase
MGSAVAQRVWRRHPQRLDGLVLGAAPTGWWNAVPWERVGASVLAGLIEVFSPRPGLPRPVAPDSDVRNDLKWLLGQFQSTSPGGIARAVAEMTRFDSTSWVGQIDVPTSVLIPLRDKAIPPRQQFWLAKQIADAQVVTVDAGHSCSVLNSDDFVVALREAVDWVRGRIELKSRGNYDVPPSSKAMTLPRSIDTQSRASK